MRMEKRQNKKQDEIIVSKTKITEIIQKLDGIIKILQTKTKE
jgi:hypothetical protein